MRLCYDMYVEKSRKRGMLQMRKEVMNNQVDKSTVTLAALHTVSLLEKNKMNILKRHVSLVHKY